MVYFQLCAALVAMQILSGLIASLNKVCFPYIKFSLSFSYLPWTLYVAAMLSCNTSDKYLIINY